MLRETLRLHADYLTVKKISLLRDTRSTLIGIHKDPLRPPRLYKGTFRSLNIQRKSGNIKRDGVNMPFLTTIKCEILPKPCADLHIGYVKCVIECDAKTIQKWKGNNHFELVSNTVTCQQSALLKNEKRKDLEILPTNIFNIQSQSELEYPILSEL